MSGRSPQVSPPGSPGRATVDVRQISFPVCASCAEMKQTSFFYRWHPVMPATIMPFTTIGPLE